MQQANAMEIAIEEAKKKMLEYDKMKTCSDLPRNVLQELIERLEHIAKTSEPKKDNHSPDVGKKVEDGWISVENRLPEEGKPVIVTSTIIAENTRWYFYEVSEYGTQVKWVTHWRTVESLSPTT